MWYARFAGSTAQTSALFACLFFYIRASFYASAYCTDFILRPVVRTLRWFHRTNFGTLCVPIFLYPCILLRKCILHGYKKMSAHYVCTQRSLWSEWRDLNSRPYGPEPYALPNCATPRNIYASIYRSTAFRNIHHLLHFCNRKTESSEKNIEYFAYLQKSFAKCVALIYNNSRDGAWCSGSTWASDSHCVGSIPIAPANANTLLSERVFSYIRHSACLHEKSGGYKKKVTR